MLHSCALGRYGSAYFSLSEAFSRLRGRPSE